MDAKKISTRYYIKKISTRYIFFKCIVKGYKWSNLNGCKKEKLKFVLPIKLAEKNLDAFIPFLVMQH